MLILYDFLPEDKTNVCFIRSDNFYCIFKENEGVFEQILAGYLSDIKKEYIINILYERRDIPDFFKDYIKIKL